MNQLHGGLYCAGTRKNVNETIIVKVSILAANGDKIVIVRVVIYDLFNDKNCLHVIKGFALKR